MSGLNRNHGERLSDADLAKKFAIKVKVADGYKGQGVARLHISVGQPYHENGRFRATLDWALDNFDQVIVCVNDTLQRHNLVFEGKDPKEALRISKERGENWVQRNITAEYRVDARLKIVRWEDWRELDDYKETMADTREAIESDPRKRQSIEDEAVTFWERVKERKGLKTDAKKGDFLKHSRAYLKEECAVFQMMFARTEAADIYPGSTLIPCELFKPKKKDGAKRGFTRIDFKEISSAESPNQALGSQSGTGRISMFASGRKGLTNVPPALNPLKFAGG